MWIQINISMELFCYWLYIMPIEMEIGLENWGKSFSVVIKIRNI